MTMLVSRRGALAAAALGAAVGASELGFLSRLPPVWAEETKVDPNVVRLDASIEPLVQVIERTPRDKLLEEIGARIRKGLSYRDLLAALQLAGVRNVEPRPSVGFKFHSVLVVNSAHLASISSPAEHRWLPIFWALDYYKSAEAQDTRERNWTMKPVSETNLPSAAKARTAFIAAMDQWDEAKADAAIAAFSRTAGLNEIYEVLFRYGVRDLRAIGHKAIFVANSLRTLEVIGPQHAEPVLRSLAYAILQHEGTNPAERDEEADRPYRKNTELAAKIRPEWQEGKLDRDATQTLIDTLRTATSDEACQQVVALLNKGIAPQSVWDAYFVVAGELLMRQPAIVAIHAVTTSNAVRYAYDTTASDETRRILLLQNAAFLVMFRDAVKQRGKVADRTIAMFQAGGDAPKPDAGKPDGAAVTGEVFAQLSKNPDAAAKQAFAGLRGQTSAAELMDAARVLVFLKGNDSHDYKFSSAVLEDYYRLSPEWRDYYLASNLYKLRGSTDADTPLVARTRAALG